MSDRNDEFFVGYLPTSQRQGKFLRKLAGVALMIAGAISVSIAAFQRDPGVGRWNDADGQTFTGTLEPTPYPMLHTPQQNYLLVGEGKHGVELGNVDSLPVTFAGTLIERPPLAVIEVTHVGLDSNPATTTAQPSGGISIPPSNSEAITLRGEIIDPKCYAGAMKPGDGKPHKACATLCIRGGIPPMFRAVDSGGQPTLYLLTNADGSALVGDNLEQIVPFIADRIECHGTISQHGDTKLLHLMPDTLRRL